MSKKKPPRNSFVVAMTLRCRSEVFHDKRDERGGSKNEERKLLSEAEEETLEDEEDFESH